MRVCFFGTYEQNYVRNITLIEGLRLQGWDVQECHVPVWENERNKTGKYLQRFSLVMRGMELVLAYFRLFFKYMFLIRAYDIMLVGYIGHLDIPLAWLLTRFPRRPLVFSPLISLYDTLVDDRQVFSRQSLMGRFLRRLDRWACNRSDLILLDTEAHIRYFSDTFDLPQEKFVRVFVGSYGLKSVPRPPMPENAPFRVVFLGKFTPLHGLDIMIRAAVLLKEEPGVEFHFIGSGQLSEEVHASVAQLALSNIHFLDWIAYERIPELMAGMDVCLGIFGTSAKALRVIPSKVFLALSLGKPVITADTCAIRELLTHGETALLCEQGNPKALSQAILQARQNRDLLDNIGRAGYQLYLQQTSADCIGLVVTTALERLLSPLRSDRG